MLMPGMDGRTFLGQKRVNPALVPLVLVTGLPVASPEWASGLRASGLVGKPIDVDLLRAAVKEAA